MSSDMMQMTTEKQCELGAAGMRAYPNVARAWGLTEAQAAQLLGIAPSTYRYWRHRPERADLDVDHLERLSLILGIYKNLHTLLPSGDAADNWVRRPNANPIFQHQSPLQRMLAGQVMDLAAVHRHLDEALGR